MIVTPKGKGTGQWPRKPVAITTIIWIHPVTWVAFKLLIAR